MTKKTKLMNFKYDPTILKKWVAINKDKISRNEAYDCVVNSLSFFNKLTNNEAIELSNKIHEEKKKGMGIEEIQNKVYETENKWFHFITIHDSNIHKNFNNAIHYLKQNVGNDEGTILFLKKGGLKMKAIKKKINKKVKISRVPVIYPTNNSGHAVVYFKIKMGGITNDQGIIFDPQQETIAREFLNDITPLEKFLKNIIGDTGFIYVLESTNKRNIGDVTNSSSPPRKKTKKNLEVNKSRQKSLNLGHTKRKTFKRKKNNTTKPYHSSSSSSPSSSPSSPSSLMDIVVSSIHNKSDKMDVEQHPNNTVSSFIKTSDKDDDKMDVVSSSFINKSINNSDKDDNKMDVESM
jgi:hypothetical protein